MTIDRNGASFDLMPVTQTITILQPSDELSWRTSSKCGVVNYLGKFAIIPEKFATNFTNVNRKNSQPKRNPMTKLSVNPEACLIIAVCRLSSALLSYRFTLQ